MNNFKFSRKVDNAAAITERNISSFQLNKGVHKMSLQCGKGSRVRIVKTERLVKHLVEQHFLRKCNLGNSER